MNKLKNIRHRIWLSLTCVLLLLCSLSACTYDYFVDETNYYLFVPQIKDGTIDDFTVAIFDNSGKLALLKQYDEQKYVVNEKLRQGVIQLNLKPGNYTVSCFSGSRQAPDYTPLLNTTSINKDVLLSQAYVGLLSSTAAKNFYLPSPDLMTINGGALPIKVPFLNQLYYDDGSPVKTSDTLRLARHYGQIRVKVKGMDVSTVSRVDMITNGLSTTWGLNGTRGLFTPNDKIHVSSNLSKAAEGNVLEFSHRYFPSMPDTKLSADLYFTLTNADASTTVASLNISSEEFERLSSGKVTSLGSNEVIEITIENLIVVGITVKGWDEDIQDGGDEDM